MARVLPIAYRNCLVLPITALSLSRQLSLLHIRTQRPWHGASAFGVARQMMSSGPSSVDDMSHIREQKQALRRDIRSKLKQLSREEIQEQSNAVWDRLITLPVYQNAQSIGLFLSMPTGEISTDKAIAHAVQDGKAIYVPHVGANFELADMELIKVPYDDMTSTQSTTSGNAKLFHHGWPKNKWGIPEPPADLNLQPAQPGDIDLMIVPGLAFDRSGHRLGQGKGYYDRFLSRMRADPNVNVKHPVLVAVGMNCQLLNDDHQIPVHEHDVSVDWVIVPTETIAIAT